MTLSEPIWSYVLRSQASGSLSYLVRDIAVDHDLHNLQTQARGSQQWPIGNIQFSCYPVPGKFLLFEQFEQKKLEWIAKFE